jgi:hypothetical protein
MLHGVTPSGITVPHLELHIERLAVEVERLVLLADIIVGAAEIIEDLALILAIMSGRATLLLRVIVPASTRRKKGSYPLGQADSGFMNGLGGATGEA